MKIKASIHNSSSKNEIVVSTEGEEKKLAIPPKLTEPGSSVNGGELLFLALATCYCNDLYREAARRKIDVSDVAVEVAGEFGNEGEPGFNIRYKVNIKSSASPEDQKALIEHVDQVAEIHNTLRQGVRVTLKD